jgi:type II secretory ATPase GspE/PulE/Tfp pilus assembly ATPase PilB-like protein
MHAGGGSLGLGLASMHPAILLPPALVELPSFSGFPWGPLALTASLCLAIVACIVALAWSRTTADVLGADQAGRWNLVFGILGVGLLAACTLGFVWAVPALVACLVVAGAVFIRAKDAGLPEGRRVMMRGGLKNLVAELRPHAAPWTVATAGHRPRSLREQLTDVVGRWRSRLAGSTAAKPAGRRKGKASGPGDGFAFLKKDGTVVLTVPTQGKPGARLSPHVLKAQQLLQSVIRDGGSTLCFEPVEQRYEVTSHVRGADKSLEKCGGDEGRGVIATLKVMADMAGSDTDSEASRHGVFGVMLRGVRYRIEVESSGPAATERMLLRLQRADALQPHGLDAQGFRPKLLAQLREAVARPYGMLLVVGPSGSGRTTTLYAALRELDARKRKIMTVESPVQQHLEDVVQIEVDRAGGATTSSVLQMVMRKDPDVVMVGDLDDRKTCEIAMQAALTGHFVFAAFEAKDSIDALVRLVGLGVEPMLVQTAVTAVLAQRLARRLCPSCKVPCDPPEALVRKFNLKPGAIKHVYKEKGCPACSQTGFLGVVPVHELLVVNDQIRRLITAAAPARELKAAAVLGGTLTLQIDGLTKVVHGDTTVQEILRVTG